MQSNREPTIYVAGPMRGIEAFNFPAFDTKTNMLKSQNWKVVNPAEMDRNDGEPSNNPHEFNPAINYEDHEFMREALKRDLVSICENCTAIYMMDGWESSRGAKAEWHLAKALGLDIYYEVPLPSYD